ncbi:hypothetical protein P6U16_22075 (plasmid) [Rhizobium sp. 32-5/1]|uniref:hypothetical protein n=1 Tax=Rhizobium sp. 32-5/1 TaxID=3019602 RepID=UPI00240D4838|nr:hypothetical protein [Rhizobium sp. 32-5/1]WEZ85742.1 hypothetical protein P6U16_22075 [Rhizobium sp. 32-5/1]
MHGASISRWTMAYFAASLAFLMSGLVLMGCGYGLPIGALGTPETLAVLHVIAVGWLGLLFAGALLQFVPVLAATHLRLPWLAGPALVLLILGLAVLSLGFTALSGRITLHLEVMPLGGVFLSSGFTMLTVSLATTIIAEKSFDVPGILVLSGLAGLVATALTGSVFAGVLSGLVDFPDVALRLSDLAPFHAASGLLGWMTITAVGVSYRLFAMFLLAPEVKGSSRRTVSTALCALLFLCAAVASGLHGTSFSAMSTAVAVLATGVSTVFYVIDVWRMFRARRRKVLELNSVAGLVALGFLVAGVALLQLAWFSGVSIPVGTAAFYALALGWLSGLGLSQLFKIVPFLTWLETYGPVMGRGAVPRVQDLVNERRARGWFVIFYLSVTVGAGAILADAGLFLQAASLCQGAAVIGLAVEYLRARRLIYAPADVRLPDGAVMPRLFYAKTNHQE